MRIVATLLLIVLAQAARATPEGWVKIDLLGVEGMSGLAMVSENRYVTCDGSVLAELDLDSLAVIPLADADMTGMTHLEAVCRMPGASGRYLLVGEGKVQEVVRDANGDYTLGPLSFTLLGADGSREFEGFDAVAVGEHTVMVWGDRLSGNISYASFPPERGQAVAPLETVVYRPPLKGEAGGMTLAVSDLKVSESGDLVIVSNTRSRNSLPDSTCVAIAGHFGFEHGRPKLILRAKPELLFSEKTGRTIEGLERGAEGWILVTEDDGSAAFKTFQPAEAQLFDGRVNFTRRDPRLSQAEIALVGAELFRRASHPVLKRRLDPLEPTLGDFEVQDRVEGSFTRADARQQAYLYRYSSTNGLVITEQDEVVAHYSGDPGDYAHFIASHRAPDLNDDGLDEIVLVCANDDSSDLYAHVFSLGPSGASHLGGATLFTSTNLPAGGVMASQETAYRGVATGSALAGQRYVRLADGSWSAQGESEWLQLEDAGRFLLRRLDDGRGL